MTDTTLAGTGEEVVAEAAGGAYQARVDAVDRAEWYSLVETFDDATVFQTWDYESVRWGEQRLSHVVLERGGEAIAAAQVRVVRMPVLKGGIAYIYSGPLWRRRERPADIEVFAQMLAALRREYVEKRGLVLRLVVNEIETDDRQLQAALEDCGFRRLSRVKPYRSFVIDLAQTEDEIVGGFKARCRTRYRSAVRKGLEAEVGTSDRLFEEFLYVYGLMRQRKQFEEHIDVRDFQKVQSRLPEPLKMRVVACRADGEPAAVAVCAAVGRTGNLLLLATSELALKTNASLLTVYRGMVELKKLGVRFFDMGGVDPEDNPGGYLFKSCFGGEEVFHLGTYEACDNRVSFLVVHGGERLRRAALKSVAMASRIIPAKRPQPAPPGEDAPASPGEED